MTSEHRLERAQLVPRPLEEVFSFCADPGNLGLITPPWLGFRTMTEGLEMRSGLTFEYRIRPLGRLAHALLVRRQLEAIFAYRERVSRELLS
jgi:ligand-binding SRPBCC domain-containing protein